MRVFVTGGTGFIGSAVVRELPEAGHQVLGLARSQSSAAALSAAGADAHRGTLTDLDALQAGAAAVDGVAHLAGAYGEGSFAAALEVDRRALMALGSVLEGSDRPLVLASTTSRPAPTSGDRPPDAAGRLWDADPETTDIR